MLCSLMRYCKVITWEEAPSPALVSLFAQPIIYSVLQQRSHHDDEPHDHQLGRLQPLPSTPVEASVLHAPLIGHTARHCATMASYRHLSGYRAAARPRLALVRPQLQTRHARLREVTVGRGREGGVLLSRPPPPSLRSTTFIHRRGTTSSTTKTRRQPATTTHEVG